MTFHGLPVACHGLLWGSTVYSNIIHQESLSQGCQSEHTTLSILFALDLIAALIMSRSFYLKSYCIPSLWPDGNKQLCYSDLYRARRQISDNTCICRYLQLQIIFWAYLSDTDIKNHRSDNPPICICCLQISMAGICRYLLICGSEPKSPRIYFI